LLDTQVAVGDHQVTRLGIPYAQLHQELAWCLLVHMVTSGTSSLCQALCIVDFADEAAKRGTSNGAYFVRHQHTSAILWALGCLMAGKLQAMARELVRSSVVGCACDCVHYLECTHRSLDEWTPIAPFSSITRAVCCAQEQGS